LGYFIYLEICFSVNLTFFVSGISELQVCVSAVADVLLWRQKHLSISILVGSTVIWFLLEKSQHTLVALLSNILFFTVIILFVWANLAALLNRPGPPVHDLTLSEDVVLSTASALRVELNKVLEVVQDVARGKDFKLFLKVVALLWIISTVASRVNFLTALWIGKMAACWIPPIVCSLSMHRL
jgi:hypothetical protein